MGFLLTLGSPAICHRFLLCTHSVLLAQPRLNVDSGPHCLLVTTDTTWKTEPTCEAGGRPTSASVPRAWILRGMV